MMIANGKKEVNLQLLGLLFIKSLSFAQNTQYRHVQLLTSKQISLISI